MKNLAADGPGMSVVVQKNGRIVYSGARGMANMELDVPLTENHVFRLGSMTKQFTGAAIMILQEQEKLSVHGDIRKYIPNFPTEGHKINIEHLLTHTSGIANYTDNRDI